MVAPARSAAGLVSSLPTLAEDQRLQGEDGGKDREIYGEMDGKIDGEMAVERDSNRRTGGLTQ